MRYAVVFNGETELNIDSDSLEKEHGKDANSDGNAAKLKYIIRKALKQEPTLLLDIQTLSFEAGNHNYMSLIICPTSEL